jgi:simple sugar transport system ATP-binding protein
VLLQVEGLHDEALLQDISLRLRKGEILVSPGWPARENRTVQSAVWRQQKPRDARRAEQPAVAAARPGRFGAARLALVPEERRKEGIFIEEPIGMNLAVSADNSFSRWSLFGHRRRGAGRKR